MFFTVKIATTKGKKIM